MKKICIKLIAITIILITMLSTICLGATKSKSDLEKDQSKVKNEIDEKKDELDDVKAEKSETMEQVENLIDKISDYETDINELNDKVSKLNKSISETQKELEKSQEDYSKQEDLLNQRLVSMYEAGNTTYLDVLLSSEDFTDLISKWYLISEIASYDTDMLEKIEKQKKQVEDAKTKLETDKNELQTAKATKEAKSVELKQAKKEKDSKVATLSEEEKSIKDEIEELKKEDKEIAAKISKYSEYVPPKNNNSSGNSSSNNGAMSSYGFIRPVNGGYVGTGYGVSGKMWSLGYHTGIDFNGVSGNPIYAVGDGKVVQAVNNSGSYGTHVMISHGNGIYSFYAHGISGSLKVSEGQIVSRGQQLMNVGSTGNVSGPHLHFEIRTSPGGFKNCVNPTSYIPI